MVGVTPSGEVTGFMALSFYMFDLILAAAFLILLPFMDVEKHLPKINADLLKRRKEAVLARGEVWVDPEELERREREQHDKEREENRLIDLKAYCEKKGLDFEMENAKYLEKQEAKQMKQAAKAARKTARKT